MKAGTLIVVLILPVLLLAGQPVALAGEAEQAAQKAALAWLDLVDRGEYAQSWDRAAELFKGAITRERWLATLKGVRPPLGDTVSRELKSAQYAESLPGAPDGKYVVIQYNTRFTQKKEALETVTPMLDPDGVWRVSGYFIK